MSIFASFFSIEDERQWMAALQDAGIKTGIIRDSGPEFDDLDAPIIYQGSHVMPDEADERGGSVHLASIPAHVRYWQENPDAPTETEPEEGHEPFLRLDIQAHENTYYGGGDATVILTKRQATRLRDNLTWWLEEIL